MDTREVARQYRLNKWAEIVRECRSSGQTVSGWCTDNGINPKSYYYWLKRVRLAACEALPSLSQNNSIVPVTPPLSAGNNRLANQGAPSDILIHFGAVTLEIRNHASATLIENTLRALQHVR